MNPFVAGASGTRMGRPLQKAFGELIRHIGLQTSIIAVVGSAGTGKSMLADMTARACVDMGLTVRRIDHGDQVYALFGTKSDVLLIDQTDSMPTSSLQTLLSPEGKNITTTMVFMCLPSCVGQVSFSGGDRATVELTPLSLSDARNYLNERAASIGRANLYSPEALDLVIDGSRGLPRLLRSIAHQAYWAAASEGAPQIGVQHVSDASGSQGVEPDQTHGDDARRQATRDVAVTSQTRSPLISPAQPRPVKKITPADSVKESRGRQRRWIDIWMPRIAGLAGSVAIGAVVWFTLMTLISGKPVAVPSAARAPSAVAMPARSKPTVAPPASAVQPTRENAAVEQGGAASRVVDEKPLAETERTSGIAIVSDPIPSVPSEAETTARRNDAGEQTAALKPTEEQAAKARAEQDEAAVQAFLLAQEAGRQAQAARDAAAAKEAAQRARAARRNANRPFMNSVFGIR